MDSSSKNWSSRWSGRDREEGSLYPEAGYNRGYGSSQGQPYRYGEATSAHDRGEPRTNADSNPGNLYGGHGEDMGYGPGYSTANDFADQQSPFERSRRTGRDYRGYNREDLPQYRERYKRSEYPETYRSAMSGYMSEHVGTDSGRRDYNRNTGQGNLYGTRYGIDQRSQQAFQRRGEGGYMSEEDYDRGSPAYSGQQNTYDQPSRHEGPYKGRGPKNYKRADNRIQEDINDRLTDDPFVDASDIDVSVQACEVTLTGTVASRQAKRRAEDIADSVSGIMHIENRLRVRSHEATEEPPVVTPY